MKTNYLQFKEMQDEITTEEFDDLLLEILSHYKGHQLLSIPGIYELFAEEFNNDVLELAARIRRGDT